MKINKMSCVAAAALAWTMVSVAATNVSAEPRTNDASALRGAAPASVKAGAAAPKATEKKAEKKAETKAAKKPRKSVQTATAANDRDTASLSRVTIRTGEMRATTAYAPGGSASNVVSVASRYVGSNPTGRSMLWCMAFVRVALDKAGYKTTASNHSSAALKYGPRITRGNAKPGDLVYHARKGGGHVEIFAGWANAEKTRYKAITGNSCGKRGKRYVCEMTRPVSKMQAVIRPQKS